MKSRRVRWHVARMEEINTYTIFVGEIERMRPLGRGVDETIILE
jgi:hypothetical protein